MPITTSDRFFGEGIPSTGVEVAKNALDMHREHVRINRLSDLLGKEASLKNYEISRQADKIMAALDAADAQVDKDNASFIKRHKLDQSEKD